MEALCPGSSLRILYLSGTVMSESICWIWKTLETFNKTEERPRDRKSSPKSRRTNPIHTVWEHLGTEFLRKLPEVPTAVQAWICMASEEFWMLAGHWLWSCSQQSPALHARCLCCYSWHNPRSYGCLQSSGGPHSIAYSGLLWLLGQRCHCLLSSTTFPQVRLLFLPHKSLLHSSRSRSRSTCGPWLELFRRRTLVASTKAAIATPSCTRPSKHAHVPLSLAAIGFQLTTLGEALGWAHKGWSMGTNWCMDPPHGIMTIVISSIAKKQKAAWSKMLVLRLIREMDQKLVVSWRFSLALREDLDNGWECILRWFRGGEKISIKIRQ